MVYNEDKNEYEYTKFNEGSTKNAKGVTKDSKGIRKY